MLAVATASIAEPIVIAG